MKRRSVAGFDLVSAEARSKVDGWTERSQHLFGELLEDAPTDMQRELLNRSVAAGHSAAEVHAFADALRGLSDSEAFDKCTIERGDSAPGYTVVQLLKAEGDPLFAFKLKGGELSPAEEGPKLPDASLPYVPPGAPGRERPKFDQTDPKIRMRQALNFDAKDDGALKKTAAAASRELGSSPDAPLTKPISGSHSAVPPAGSGPVLAQDLLNEAMHALGVMYREQPVDGNGQLKLEEVMTQAAQALQRGLPVPVALGPQPGQDRRLALFLQVQHSGKSRAYQLFDVLSQEIAWLNEGDLFARTELPFANKQNRRITRIALPVMKSF